MQRIPFSSFTPVAARGNPKGFFTPRRATSSTARRALSGSLTTVTKRFSGARKTLSWIIGHSYGLYGPLAAGATTLLCEGRLNYPKPDRPWEIIDKHRVNIFYTTPAVLRSCMKEKDEWVTRHDLSSLRILGSVGEPINPQTWMWYHTTVGKRTMSDRGYMVANRDRCNLDRTLPRSHASETGICNFSFFRSGASHSEGRWNRMRERMKEDISSSNDPGPE